MRDDYAEKDQPCSRICILQLLLGSGHAYHGRDGVMPENTKGSDEVIKKREEEEAARLKWEEQERKKHQEALEHKKRLQQHRDAEVRVKCTYCTSGELHTQREVIHCLEAYVKGQKKEMLL